MRHTRCNAGRRSRGDNGATLVNIIIVFGRNTDRNVQRFVNGRFRGRLWTYFRMSSNVFGPKTSEKNFFRHFI